MDVEEIVDGDSDSLIGYLVKGHVADTEIEAAICKQCDEDFEIEYAEQIEQTVKRKVPCHWYDGWSFMYWDSDPGRGAFECTIAWLE